MKYISKEFGKKAKVELFSNEAGLSILIASLDLQTTLAHRKASSFGIVFEEYTHIIDTTFIRDLEGFHTGLR
jgi:hypothetical protein